MSLLVTLIKRVFFLVILFETITFQSKCTLLKVIINSDIKQYNTSFTHVHSSINFSGNTLVNMHNNRMTDIHLSTE